MSPALRAAFRFFHEHAAYIVGERGVGALHYARMEAWGRDHCVFVWSEDDSEWDGAGPAPEGPAAQVVAILDPTDDERDDLEWGRRTTLRGLNIAASLGGIWGADRDYRRVVEAELASEAYGVWDAKQERAALELASRATYAGPYCGLSPA